MRKIITLLFASLGLGFAASAADVAPMAQLSTPDGTVVPSSGIRKADAKDESVDEYPNWTRIFHGKAKFDHEFQKIYDDIYSQKFGANEFFDNDVCVFKSSNSGSDSEVIMFTDLFTPFGWSGTYYESSNKFFPPVSTQERTADPAVNGHAKFVVKSPDFGFPVKFTDDSISIDFGYSVNDETELRKGHVCIEKTPIILDTFGEGYGEFYQISEGTADVVCPAFTERYAIDVFKNVKLMRRDALDGSGKAQIWMTEVFGDSAMCIFDYDPENFSITLKPVVFNSVFSDNYDNANYGLNMFIDKKWGINSDIFEPTYHPSFNASFFCNITNSGKYTAGYEGHITYFPDNETLPQGRFTTFKFEPASINAEAADIEIGTTAESIGDIKPVRYAVVPNYDNRAGHSSELILRMLKNDPTLKSVTVDMEADMPYKAAHAFERSGRQTLIMMCIDKDGRPFHYDIKQCNAQLNENDKWVSLGMGEYTDSIIMYNRRFNTEGAYYDILNSPDYFDVSEYEKSPDYEMQGTWRVEVQQNKADTTLYRLVSPYRNAPWDGFHEGFNYKHIWPGDSVAIEESCYNYFFNDKNPDNNYYMIFHTDDPQNCWVEQSYLGCGWDTEPDGKYADMMGYMLQSIYEFDGKMIKRKYDGLKLHFIMPDYVALENVSVESNDAPVEYFNLQGLRVDNPQNGVYIRRQGNKTSKVLIR